jgi:hypothetical protein
VQTYLVAAATVAALVGITHSTLGEALIFRKLRKGTLIPNQASTRASKRANTLGDLASCECVRLWLRRDFADLGQSRVRAGSSHCLGTYTLVRCRIAFGTGRYSGETPRMDWPTGSLRIDLSRQRRLTNRWSGREKGK